MLVLVLEVDIFLDNALDGGMSWRGIVLADED